MGRDDVLELGLPAGRVQLAVEARFDSPEDDPGCRRCAGRGSGQRDQGLVTTTSSAKSVAAGLRTLRTDGPYAQNVYWSAT